MERGDVGSFREEGVVGLGRGLWWKMLMSCNGNGGKGGSRGEVIKRGG
jgi:hypothetical protein